MVALSKAMDRNRPLDRGHPTSGDQLPAESGVIVVNIRELEQLFNSMDPSPFHARALDPDAEEFIVSSAKELPSGSPAALIVYLGRAPGTVDEGQVIGDAIRVYFARRAAMARLQLRRLLRRGLVSLCIGLAALAAALAGAELLTRSLGGGHAARVIGESLQIGGWVAMWHPMEIFLYEWWPIVGDQRLYQQLSRMPVRIVYTGESPAAELGRLAEPTTTRTAAPH